MLPYQFTIGADIIPLFNHPNTPESQAGAFGWALND
jgi:hypothetical protein